MHFLAEESPTGAQDRFVVFGARTKAGRGEQVASEVLLQEPVVGHVFIEGPHEVVAVVPRAPGGDVPFVAVGIGLALARRIIEVHGGRIWVESEGYKKGSTFNFTLPSIQHLRKEKLS